MVVLRVDSCYDRGESNILVVGGGGCGGSDCDGGRVTSCAVGLNPSLQREQLPNFQCHWQNLLVTQQNVKPDTSITEQLKTLHSRG
jgi:hypothetical protein